MIEIEGLIVELATENNNGVDKKVVTLNAGRNNTLFVEFQGKMAQRLKGFNTGDRARIKIRFNGKVSKLGRRYNNLIAKEINRVN